MRIHAHSPELYSVDGLVGRSDDYRKFFGKLVAGLRVVVLLPGSAVSEKTNDGKSERLTSSTGPKYVRCSIEYF